MLTNKDTESTTDKTLIPFEDEALNPGEHFAVFEGRLYPAYDLMQDWFDGEYLVCIPASNNDVACCLIFGYSSTRPGPNILDLIYASVVPATLAPFRGVPDFFRYVIADRPTKGDKDNGRS